MSFPVEMAAEENTAPPVSNSQTSCDSRIIAALAANPRCVVPPRKLVQSSVIVEAPWQLPSSGNTSSACKEARARIRTSVCRSGREDKPLAASKAAMIPLFRTYQSLMNNQGLRFASPTRASSPVPLGFVRRPSAFEATRSSQPTQRNGNRLPANTARFIRSEEGDHLRNLRHCRHAARRVEGGSFLPNFVDGHTALLGFGAC
ncbi:MAG: hypothetical protein ACI835_001112 [Planctomycetota bacterium]|jgi:hypothetical protein